MLLVVWCEASKTSTISEQSFRSSSRDGSNAVTVAPWYRKTCRSECMFVPVVDSSATEMSTLGVILLTEGSDELKSRYTLLKYNTATETSGNSRLWRQEPLRQWYTCWRKFGRWSRKPKALALGALTQTKMPYCPLNYYWAVRHLRFCMYFFVI